VGRLEDEIYDALGHPVGGAEVGAGDGDEAEYDGGRLGDLAAVGPLDALELSPGGAEKGDGATWQGVAALAGGWCCGTLAEGFEGGAVVATAATTGAATCGRELGRGAVGLKATVTLGLGRLDWRLRRDGLGPRFGIGALSRLGPGLGGHATGAADEGGVELVDLAGGVVERTREVGPVQVGRRSGGHALTRPALLLALLCTFAVTGHGCAPRR
jgi:hypothetical protein